MLGLRAVKEEVDRFRHVERALVGVSGTLKRAVGRREMAIAGSMGYVSLVLELGTVGYARRVGWKL